jgi:hypothetical protein
MPISSGSALTHHPQDLHPAEKACGWMRQGESVFRLPRPIKGRLEPGADPAFQLMI